MSGKTPRFKVGQTVFKISNVEATRTLLPWEIIGVIPGGEHAEHLYSLTSMLHGIELFAEEVEESNLCSTFIARDKAEKKIKEKMLDNERRYQEKQRILEEELELLSTTRRRPPDFEN